MTFYRTYLATLGEVDKDSLISVFKSCFSDRVKRLVDLLPELYKRFMDDYLLVFDIDSVMEILGEKIRGVGHMEPQYYSYPFSKVDYGLFVNLEGVDEAVHQMLKDPFNLEPWIVEMWEKYRELYIIDMGLRRAYYMKLLDDLERFSRDEYEAVLEIVGVEIDLTNISIIVGPMLYGYSPKIALDMLIPFSYGVSLSKLRSAYTLEVKTLTQLVPSKYREVVEYYLMGDDVLARSRMYRLVQQRAYTLLPKNPIGFGYVFPIIKLVEFEYRNLKLIAEAVDIGLSSNEIKSLIIVG